MQTFCLFYVFVVFNFYSFFRGLFVYLHSCFLAWLTAVLLLLLVRLFVNYNDNCVLPCYSATS
jgi:hypothetical protein